MWTPNSAAASLARKWAWAREAAATPGDAARLLGAFAAGRALAALPDRGFRGLRARRVTASIRANGHELRIRHRLDWGDLTTLYGVFRAGLYRLPAFEPNRAPVVVDLGANIGLFSLFLSTLMPPDARFVCVEPNPANAALLRENLAVNGLNATVLPLAVGPERGRAPFYVHRDADAHTLDPGRRTSVPADVIEVETAPLGEILDMAGVSDIDVLKIDVEGAERTIFDDVDRWAPRVHGALWIDIHEDLVDSDAVLADLGRAGFRAAPETWVPSARGFIPTRRAAESPPASAVRAPAP